MIILVVVGFLVLVGGYMVMTQNDKVNDTDLTETSDLVVTPTVLPISPLPSVQPNIFVTLQTQGTFGQSGTATIMDNADKKAVVRLSLSGGAFTAPQPAHIHLGSCPTPGAVKYSLTSVTNGVSETVLTVSLAEIMAVTDKMAINVHKSAQETSVYTACGDILVSPTGSMIQY